MLHTKSRFDRNPLFHFHPLQFYFLDRIFSSARRRVMVLNMRDNHEARLLTVESQQTHSRLTFSQTVQYYPARLAVIALAQKEHILLNIIDSHKEAATMAKKPQAAGSSPAVLRSCNRQGKLGVRCPQVPATTFVRVGGPQRNRCAHVSHADGTVRRQGRTDGRSRSGEFMLIASLDDLPFTGWTLKRYVLRSF
jgi:hypothetical protein